MPSLKTQNIPRIARLEKAAIVSDIGLVRIHQELDFLFRITPVNMAEEWKKFERKRFDAIPHFHYHLKSKKLPELKQKLKRLPLHQLDDPILRRLFREKAEELDRKIEMLAALGTPVFLEGSFELYRPPNNDLVRAAKRVLEHIPALRKGSEDLSVTAEEFARRAREEVNDYRKQDPKLEFDVQTRSDFSDLMVSGSRLFVGGKLKLSPRSAEALIQHEVGTHLLTFWNGSREPLRLLGAGFPGYEELQEGLAVFSEYLSGGMDAERLRVLAGRVVAVRSLVNGAQFLDSFRLLYQTHGFDAKSAFLIASRVHRAGGLTKDTIYLRGLLSLAEFLKKPGPFDVLWIGKIALAHVPLIRDLLHKGVLSGPHVKPRYLEWSESARRLGRVKQSASPFDFLTMLIEEVK